MSETVHYKGTLKEIKKLENETLENQCKRLLDNEKLSSYCESYREMLEDENYEKLFIYDDVLYSVEMQEIDPYDDLFVANKNEDGTIGFEVKYYNGGCGFNEAIGYAIKKME